MRYDIGNITHDMTYVAMKLKNGRHRDIQAPHARAVRYTGPTENPFLPGAGRMIKAVWDRSEM